MVQLLPIFHIYYSTWEIVFIIGIVFAVIKMPKSGEDVDIKCRCYRTINSYHKRDKMNN
ncbi:hypothetical protein PEC301899_05910 [Pectobacterium carotovorum subsp. carotovorum]|nr:hypothetical protein PEC301899_05910 [Pectobacterium carotovorum subsp. carotovorum]